MLAYNIILEHNEAMIDRDELLRFRIDNYLSVNKERLRRVPAGLGSLVLRQSTAQKIAVGTFASNRREHRRGNAHYFIESTQADTNLGRQLWLPALKWIGFGTANEREIVATSSRPEDRFAAWQDAQPLVANLNGYSRYEGEGQALFEEAKLLLHFLDANDSSFQFRVE